MNNINIHLFFHNKQTTLPFSKMSQNRVLLDNEQDIYFPKKDGKDMMSKQKRFYNNTHHHTLT